MSSIVPKKRKTAFWNPPRIKKRRLTTSQWHKKRKPTQQKSFSTPDDASNTKAITKQQNKSNDDDDDNDTFEIVKISKPKLYKSNTIDPNEVDPSSTTLKIKFATPSKGKHTEYNLKSLQNTDSTNNTNNQYPNELETETNNMNISSRTDIISKSSEWHKLGEMNEHLINHVRNFMKLTHPTVIQTKSIPHLLSHKDLLIKSETGSGKTLAYLIPIVSSLMTELISRSDGCKVMIIAPTRELSLQIYNVTNILCRHTPFIVIGHLMGGEDKRKEKARIRKGLTMVIGTPGRILDHFENTQSFKFDLIQWLVLDEADILLNLGFEKFIRSIVQIIENNTSVMERCNILVSATLDNRIQKLAAFLLHKHIFISLNEGDDNTYIPYSLKHNYICLKREYQSIGLIGLLQMLYFQNKNKWKTFKVIIFMSTCAVINYYFTLFKDCKLFPKSKQKILPLKHEKNGEEIKWFELRGDMAQKDRTSTFFEFCNVNNGVLFCTDVASRGLDIPKVNVIIQYDPPAKLQDYIHRSGRTARMGRAGQTILFLTPKELKYLDILKKNKFQFNQVPIGHVWNQLDVDYEKYKANKIENKTTDGYDSKAAMLMMNYDNSLSNYKDKSRELSSRNVIMDHLKEYVMGNDELKGKARSAMRTFVKAYTTYPRQLKSIFFIQNLDFYQCSKCFFVEREGRFLRKGGMRGERQRHKFSQQMEMMRDVAQKITKKRNVPSKISEFAAM